jgi:hypothetical protein
MFCEKTSDHNAGWIVHKVHFPVCDPILDEEISDIDVSGSLPGQRAAVRFHFHSAHVVLKEVAVVNRVPCASIKLLVQMGCGRKSLAPTSSALVELFVFNFCLEDLP